MKEIIDRGTISVAATLTRPATDNPSWRLRMPRDTTTGRILPEDPTVRFWRFVEKTETCWPWTGALITSGYGQFSPTRRKPVLAHRWSYEAMIGPIPPGLQIDHLCRVRNCVNPAHLEPVSGRVNTLRGLGPSAVAARTTHCPRGHEYTVANTYLWKNRRACRACGSERHRKSRLGKSFVAPSGGQDE